MIITGCQRSGTMSVASALGLPHEVQFTPQVDWGNLARIKIRLRSEVSWMAAPFAAELRTPIIHLIRHPLKVVNSLVGIDFWTGDTHEPYRSFLKNFCPVPEKADPITQSLVYWHEWNQPLSHYPRIRLEDWTNLPQMNGREKANLTWDDVPHSEWKEKTQDLAREYGY